MSLPGSGTIKLSEIKAEFGKGNNLLDYLGEGGVTGSAPLKLTDFYGKSAGPDLAGWDAYTRRYAELQGSTTPDGRMGQKSLCRIANPQASGSMWGSPDSLTGTQYYGCTTGDSVLNRIVQHCVDSEATFTWMAAMQVAAVLSWSTYWPNEPTWIAVDKNGYKSNSWSDPVTGFGKWECQFMTSSGAAYKRTTTGSLVAFNWSRVIASDEAMRAFAEMDHAELALYLKRNPDVGEVVQQPRAGPSKTKDVATQENEE